MRADDLGVDMRSPPPRKPSRGRDDVIPCCRKSRNWFVGISVSMPESASSCNMVPCCFREGIDILNSCLMNHSWERFVYPPPFGRPLMACTNSLCPWGGKYFIMFILYLIRRGWTSKTCDIVDSCLDGLFVTNMIDFFGNPFGIFFVVHQTYGFVIVNAVVR